ncbi:putative leucyl aminopeptidase precursor [Burkholderia cenocepacia]|uniref:M20/M25/M40 family metallo-hydrolase n=1 Tax=Burkholderia cenocepacia TaxID=95486 RepID=UPI0008467816|nr:M20/M25/M40 family metallo-hydrolase [Burkholderia cenocepacia]MDR8101286.1 M20/M25/M40 family metallo-hydrolase [Burkholderia cenocepacia]RQU36853.1 M20/M25/M40 family metallo-hydrolase [Burkholderia cenocepacia]CAB5116315.1 putative leucyl aminopeptidase precursor [Burkholderia cenocepacia]CAB5134684.1 putative leucyl aminopeptidase precursor [Burkholderia cenocepacia]CAB5141952.1 putative leucyl aminopeptidase precursor [Burkholderia cenocepacia]
MPTLKPTRLSAALGGMLLTAAAHATPVWITLGDTAFRQLQRIDATATAQYSTTVDAGKAADGAARRETVHVVEIDDSRLGELARAVHHTRGHGPGYVVHDSFDDARQALQPLPATLAKQATAAYTVSNVPQIGTWVQQLQASNIVGTITSLSGFTNRYYTTSHGVAASDWLALQWKQLAGARADITVEQVAHTGFPQKSVILTIRGSDPAAGTVVLGGHLDSTVGRTTENTRSPGADDDASGIASLTEALRVLLANNYRPKRTIKFVGYAAEEAGLLGSKAIAKQFRTQNANVVGVLQLDMTNYKGDPKDIYLITDYTNAAQNTYVKNLAATYLPELAVGTSQCGYACSDHASWNAQGYPASFPFEADQNDSPYIHTVNDTLENSDRQANHALKFGKLALAYAVDLGGLAGATVKR